jgi:hypothetical protein
MKRLFYSGLTAFIVILIAAICLLARPASAQTNQIPDLLPAPVTTAVEFLSTPSTNWSVAAYGIVNTHNHDVGFGIAGFYHITENFGAVLRLDELGGVLTMPSGNFQIQKEFSLAGKFKTTMFAFTGVAIPISDENDPSVAGIVGVGFAVDLPTTGQWYLPNKIGFDVEKWTNVKGTQLRVGAAWAL